MLITPHVLYIYMYACYKLRLESRDQIKATRYWFGKSKIKKFVLKMQEIDDKHQTFLQLFGIPYCNAIFQMANYHYTFKAYR